MNKLTPTELEALLCDHEPAEIRIRYADRLDEAGLATLDEQEQELKQATAYLTEAGQSWRGALPPAPDVVLPETFNARTEGLPSTAPLEQPWWRRGGSISLLSAAAALFLGLLMPRPWHDRSSKDEKKPEIPHRVRSQGSVDSRLHYEDGKLFNSLLEHGQTCLELGNETEDREKQLELYREALWDLMGALELRDDDVNVWELLVQVHEKLDNAAELQMAQDRLDTLRNR